MAEPDIVDETPAGAPPVDDPEPEPPDAASPFGPPPAALPWEAGDSPAVLGDGFAIETRAETLEVLTFGDAVHEGDEAHLHTGAVGQFVDTVVGEERGNVHGRLTETTAKASRLTTVHQQTTVHGRLSFSAVGWPENAMSGEDSIILGGAMTDTWTGGALIAAAMSDDLVVGAGARITAPVDVWLNGLHGMEERPGSAVADGVTMDLCGTLFEREYGAAVHAAGIARFSGTVYQTQRMGFRPMMKVALGVRNLIPGAGEGAPDPAPPAAPAGAGAGEGAMLVTGVAAGSAGAARSMDSFEDMGRVADTAEDLENVSDLSRAGDTADTVDELAHVRLPDDFDTDRVLATITRQEEWEVAQAQWLRGTTENSVENVNRLIAEKIDQIAALDAADAATDVAASADDVDFTPPVKPGVDVEVPADHRGAIADLSRDISRDVTPAIPWPTGAAADPDVRRAELGAEIDALMALRMALDTDEDPIVFLRGMVDQAKDLYGPSDPRTIAVDDLLYHQERVQTMITRTQQNADLWVLARVEIQAGFDPRTMLRNIENGADHDTASRVRIVLSQINPYFTELDELARNAVTTPDVVEDVADLRRVGAVDDVPPPGSLDPTALGLDPPPAPVADADDLGTAPGAMDLLASGSADDVRQGLDLPGSDDLADGLRLDGDGVGMRTDPETGPLVQPGFDGTGAGWLDDAGTRSDNMGDATGGVHGDYEEMGPSGGAGPAVGDADDVQAVVDGVPARSVPEDFDWQQTYSEGLMNPYNRARTDLDWRPTMAYGDAINDLRDDLYRGLSEILGSSEGLEGKADDLYARALEVANGDNAVRAHKAQELLEAVDAKTYDAVVALSGRTDEFANAARSQQLDRHIDQAKLIDWLLAQQNAAAERIATVPTDAEKTVAGQEMSYWNQVFQAVSEGRSPTAESSEQIAYLRSVGNTEQVDAYLRYHDDLLQTVSDPAFHRSAAEMGDNTYAPRAFLWPELGRGADAAGPPSGADELDGVATYRNALLQRRAELRDELFALARLVDGDNVVAPLPAADDPARGSELRDMIQRFASNVDTVDGTRDALDAIDAQAMRLADNPAGGATSVPDAGSARYAVDSTMIEGDRVLDLFRSLVPDDMMDDGYLAAIDAHGRGSFSDLTGDVADLADGAADGADAGAAGRAAAQAMDAGGGAVDPSPSLIPDDMMDDGYLAAVDAHQRGSFSDLTGDAEELTDLDLATYTANRDAINRRAGARDFARAPPTPPSDLRHFALRASKASGFASTSKADRDPPTEPDTGPLLPMADADLSPDDDLAIARLVRDDGVPGAWARRTAPGRIRRWDSGVRIRSVRFGGGRTPSHDEREESANPSDEAADNGGATRWWTGGGRGADPLNLEGALPGVSPTRGSGARVAAFGGGMSPFAARGDLVRDLMQGQLLRPASVDALRSTVVEGWAGRRRTAESANLTELLAALRNGGEAGVAGSADGGLDWRTLGILLDMLDSSAAMP